MWTFYFVIANILLTLLFLPVVVKKSDRDDKYAVGLYLLFCFAFSFLGGVLFYKLLGR